MRILVTGSTGTVASPLIKDLASRGHEVFGLDRAHNSQSLGYSLTGEDASAMFIRADVGEFRQVERAMETHGPFDMVYHAAAEFGRWNGEDYYEQLWRTNAVGTKNIIRLQERLGFKMVFFSSSEVYGDWDGVMSEGVTEENPIHLLNDYALSKRVNEEQIRNSAVSDNTETVIVRLFNTYGPGEYYTPYRSVNCRFAYAAIMGLPVRVFRGHTRSSTYLQDVVSALANLPENFIPGRTYNLGKPERHTIEELAETTWRAVGASNDLIEYVEHSERLTTRDKIVDSSLAQREIGFNPETSLAEGVDATVAWLRSVYGDGSISRG